MQDEIADLMETRCAVYQMLARFWIEEVDETLLQELKSTVFPSVTETLQLEDAFRKLENYIRVTEPSMLKELAADYSMLCRGTNPVKGADPYESVHLNPLGLMMQDEWEDVLRFYRQAGLERSASSVEPEDHLGIELECMARLCLRFTKASAADDEGACRESIQLQAKMLEVHLLAWVPRFTEEVLKVAKTEFYRSVATITHEYLVMDAEYLHSIMEC